MRGDRSGANPVCSGPIGGWGREVCLPTRTPATSIDAVIISVPVEAISVFLVMDSRKTPPAGHTDPRMRHSDTGVTATQRGAHTPHRAARLPPWARLKREKVGELTRREPTRAGNTPATEHREGHAETICLKRHSAAVTTTTARSCHNLFQVAHTTSLCRVGHSRGHRRCTLRIGGDSLWVG